MAPLFQPQGEQTLGGLVHGAIERGVAIVLV
jgi:hypothetical protein